MNQNYSSAPLEHPADEDASRASGANRGGDSGAERGAEGEERDPFLTAMGDRVRLLRARRGMTRKTLANETGLSERHLANPESGVGNASVLVLRQMATLNCPLAEVIGDETTASAEWLLIRELLQGRDQAALQRARGACEMFAQAQRDPHRKERIALIGLRGAGKSTFGRMLAQERKVPFVELTRVIEQLAGCPPSEIHSLYGATAYRRYEHRALEAVIHEHRARRDHVAGWAGVGVGHLERVAVALLYRMAAGHAGRAYAPRRSRKATCGRCPATRRRWMT